MDGTDAAAAKKQLAIVRRGEAATWVDYIPTPLWCYPAIGVWAALMTFAAAQPSDTDWPGVLIFALNVPLWAFILWSRRRNGVVLEWGWQTHGMPPELRRNMWMSFAVCLAVLAIIVVVARSVGPVGGALTAFVLTSAAMFCSEKGRDRAADAARTRLDSELA